MENFNEEASFQEKISGNVIKPEIGMPSNELYIAAYCFTQKALNEVFGKRQENASATDVYALAKYHNIEILETKMASQKSVFLYGMPGYLDCYDYSPNDYRWSIYINEAMGDLTKRYIIAHELAHYLLQHRGVHYCCNPLFPKTTEEQLCDIIASFLLMPLETVLKQMEKFVKNCEKNDDKPVDMYEWLKYLGQVMKVSDYHTILCFQKVRHLGGVLYEEIKKEQDSELLKKYHEGIKCLVAEIKNSQYNDLFA